MFLFFQKSEKIPHLRINAGPGSLIAVNSVHTRNEPTYNNIYMTSIEEAKRLLEYLKTNYKDDITMHEVSIDSIKNIPDMPYLIGKNPAYGYRDDLDLIDVVESIYKEKKDTVYIGVFGEAEYAIGDILMLSNVYRDLSKQLKQKNIDFKFIYYTSNKSKDYSFIVENISQRDYVEYYPIPISEIQLLDVMIPELTYLGSEYVNSHDLHDVMAKQFCFNLSKDFSVVGTYTPEKHIQMKAKKLINNLFNNKLPTLAFNKKSSTKLRSMPNDIAEKMILKLLDSGKFNIVSFDSLQEAIFINHPNYKILSENTHHLHKYIAFLSVLDGVISVDSAPIHLAARLDIPSFGIYTTIKPELREKYYLKADSIFLENKYIGQHKLKDMTDEEVFEIWKDFNIDDTCKKIIKKFKKGFF